MKYTQLAPRSIPTNLRQQGRLLSPIAIPILLGTVAPALWLLLRRSARRNGRRVKDVMMIDKVISVDSSSTLAEAAQLMRDANVVECATAEVACARPEWSAAEAGQAMARHQVGRLPVIDEAGRLVGIVTLSSLALRSRHAEEALHAAEEVSRRSARLA